MCYIQGKVRKLIVISKAPNVIIQTLFICMLMKHILIHIELLKCTSSRNFLYECVIFSILRVLFNSFTFPIHILNFDIAIYFLSFSWLYLVISITTSTKVSSCQSWESSLYCSTMQNQYGDLRYYYWRYDDIECRLRKCILKYWF